MRFILLVLSVIMISSCRGLFENLSHYKKIQFGTAIGMVTINDPKAEQLLLTEYNAVTLENALKWKNLQRDDGSWNFSNADTLVDYAIDHGLVVRGHTLVWHNGLPSWISNNISAIALENLISNQIFTVASRYKGKITIWDVVNEAYNGRGELRNASLLTEKFGDTYIEKAFKWAHKADPYAKLFYNDFGIAEINAKSDIIYKKISELLTNGVPVNGIGMQMHISLDNYPNVESMKTNIRRFGELGLEVQITEMDVTFGSWTGTYEEKLERQADIYDEILSACVEEAAFSGVTFWGICDRYSWRNQSGDQDPLIFDSDYQKKPAYFRIKNIMLGLQNGSGLL